MVIELQDFEIIDYSKIIKWINQESESHFLDINGQVDQQPEEWNLEKYRKITP